MSRSEPVDQLSDWAQRPLGELLSGPPSYGINAASSPYDPDEPTYIRITDIDSHGRFRPNPKVSVRHPLASKYKLEDGDLVLARTGATVGKSYRYETEDGRLIFAGFLIRVTPDPHLLDSRYLSYYMQSRNYWDWVSVMSTRSGQPGINGAEYAQLPVVLPSLEEQRAIAQVLSDADDLITSIERLIAKKRDIKTAVMQGLLTGKTRLPGFDGSWSSVELGALGNTYGGLTGKSKKDFDIGEATYVPFMAVMADVKINRDKLPRVQIAANESQNLVRAGDLLFNGSSETPDELALCAIVERVPPRTYLNSFCFGLRLSEHGAAHADPLFIAYLVRGDVGRSLLFSLAQGATRYNLSKSQFRKLRIDLPTVNEQRAIAQVLSDMDAEIEALEARLVKTREIKQGMMQELLTGRTRLVDPSGGPSDDPARAHSDEPSAEPGEEVAA